MTSQITALSKRSIASEQASENGLFGFGQEDEASGRSKGDWLDPYDVIAFIGYFLGEDASGLVVNQQYFIHLLYSQDIVVGGAYVTTTVCDILV